MSTLKTTYIQHPSATNPNIELAADGTVVLPLSGIGDLADVDEGSGAADGDVLTYDGSSNLWLPQPGLAGIGSNVVDGTIYTPVSNTGTTDVTSLTITPTSATSKILIIASGVIRVNNGQNSYYRLLITDSSNNVLWQGDASGSRLQASWGALLANVSNPGNFIPSTFSIVALHAPATTSPFTYKLRISNSTTYTARIGTTSLDDADNSFTSRVPTTFIAIEVAA